MNVRQQNAIKSKEHSTNGIDVAWSPIYREMEALSYPSDHIPINVAILGGAVIDFVTESQPKSCNKV